LVTSAAESDFYYFYKVFFYLNSSVNLQ